MRIRRFHSRPMSTIVQQTAVVNTRSLLSDYMAGKPIDLNTTGVQGSYDFDGVPVDFDQPFVDSAPNKIEQALHPEKYTPGIREVVEPKPPVVEPDSPPSPAPSE